MKRAVLCLVLALVAVFGGCGKENSDFLDPFRAAYAAEMAGTLCGIEFSATMERGAPSEDGAALVTITFYAPEELAGTTLTRAADGSITVKSGGLSISDMGGVGAALLELFPTTGTVEQVQVTSEGRTRLLVGGTTLELLSDGTPYSVKTADVNALVLRWQAKN